MSGRLGMKRNSGPNTMRAKAWQSMRILKRFSLPDLLRTVAGSKKDNIGKMVTALERAGYLRCEGWSGPAGQPGSFKVWRLVRGTDQPLPPALRQKPAGAE